MTQLIAKLLLALLILPMTGAVFVLTFLLLVVRNGGPPKMESIILLWTIVYAFIAAYWILLWRKTVRWTSFRVWATLISGVISIICGGVASSLILSANREIPTPMALFIGGGFPPILWVLATIQIWRESSAERFERLARLGSAISCPICGYNLTGLREARCPECGASFTLDQLLSSQARQEEAVNSNDLGQTNNSC
jgi:hypothetical protein